MQNTELFLVTYKKMSKHPTASDYDVVKALLKKKGDILDWRYETDRRGVLHIHCLFECRKNPYLKSFIIKGYNSNFTPIYDADQVMSYISKQCANNYESEQLADAVYARHTYLF